MSEKFLNFIQSVFASSSLDVDSISTLISNSDFSTEQICEFCIDLFVNLNFTGPSDETIESKLIGSPEFEKGISDKLICEGEVPFHKTKALVLLWLAKLLTEHLRHSGLDPISTYRACILGLKCVYLHQAVLRDERSNQLKNEVDQCCQQAKEQLEPTAEGVLADDKVNICPMLEFEMNVLASHLKLQFYEYTESAALLRRCQQLIGISTELKGALGKRTRFQQDSHSQLFLELTRISNSEQDILNTRDSSAAAVINAALEPAANRSLPNNLLVDDEVLLDHPEFEVPQDATVATLAEQVVLGLQCAVHRGTRARDSQALEECKAILAAAHYGKPPSTWAITTDALLQRAQLGTASTRRTEASLMQLEEISNQFRYRIPDAALRTRWFFLARVPAIWQLQLRLASALNALNMERSALDLLLAWEQWQPAIECMVALGQRQRAEKLILERLARDGDSVELLCCLGDVTHDCTTYERAWVLSGERSARAMRSKARHHMDRDKDYEKARLCFEASLRINPLQIGVWFTYGCCCLVLKQYRLAVGAFKQCVRLEPDNYEAWNNCASAYVELGEGTSALALLKEATKCSYDNWRVWDNICIVSASVGAFNDTMKAYHRVMDLRGTHRDPATLAIVVRALAERDGPHEAIRPALRQLFARYASQDGRNANLWTLYAELLAQPGPDALSADERRKVLQCLSRAHHTLCAESGWDAEPARCRRVLISALRLVERSLEYGGDHSSARLAVKSVCAILDARKATQTESLDGDLEEMLQALRDLARDFDPVISPCANE